MSSVRGVLHDSRFVFSVVQFGGGAMLFESLPALSACFTDICGVGFTRLTVGTGARGEVDNTSLMITFDFVFGLDKRFAKRTP